VSVVTNTGNTWTFDNLGGTIFPTLTVQRGDDPSGTITGQTLLFGDGTQEAIISTPDANADFTDNSQRLVINPGAGAPDTAGEGGDIYLWAGRGGNASGSGGDIKIRGGTGGANTSGGGGGDGGYIRIEAGDAGGTGGSAGYVQIVGGVTSGADITGGYVNINGGEGQTGNGGDVNVTGGLGGTGYYGGNVNITGGGTNNNDTCGNINIVTGASAWRFDNTGNLTLPGNTFAVNYANGTPVSIGGGGGSANTISNGGSNVTIPVADGNVVVNVPSDIPTGVYNINSEGGWGVHSNPVATTGGTGSGLTVNAFSSNDNGYIDTVIIANPGTGYTNGDAITITNASNLTATFNIATTLAWKFDTDANLTLPSEGNIVGLTAVNPGSLQWVGNSSGDGAGYTTLQLRPDDSISGDNYLIIDPTAPNHIHIRAGGEQDNSSARLYLGGENSYFQVENGANANVYVASNSNQWTFGTDGNLTFPRDVVGNTDPYLRIVGGADPSISSIDVSLAGPANLDIISSYTKFTGFNGEAITIYPDDGEISGDANIQIWTNATSNVSQYSWTFDTVGKLTLPAIATPGVDTGEIAQIKGTRKIIGETGTWSTYIDGHSSFGNVAWTASSAQIQSAKITFAVQTNGTAFNWEQFDVSVCKMDGSNAYVSVSGRIKQNSAIADTAVSAYENEGGMLEVWLNPAVDQTAAYINYNAVEFNIMPD
jgi:hypothetical protein